MTLFSLHQVKNNAVRAIDIMKYVMPCRILLCSALKRNKMQRIKFCPILLYTYIAQTPFVRDKKGQ